MIAAVVIALAVMPLIVLRGRTLLACYSVDATVWLLAWLVHLRMGVNATLGVVTVAVISVSVLALFIAAGSRVRWSANRAALLAAIVYALLVPAMTKVPIDGDEPFYLLVTESMVHDRDLDLANQYRELERSATGRPDIVPQLGDPTGPEGEQYSRHEPFLSLLLVPGFLLGGLKGAAATIALFGVLLVRSTIRWMEDERVPDANIRAVFPFFAFAPPVLFYAARIWPEVPAAFFFVEAIRGVTNGRIKRWLPALLALVMLKLRFALMAAGLVAMLFRRRPKIVALAVVLAVPLLAAWLATSVHHWRELLPATPMQYATGLFGLLADGMSGIAFQAPFYLVGLFALLRWKEMPRGFRVGAVSTVLYLIVLLPRSEWHGGWAPPLRYLVFMMPLLALGAAVVITRISRGALAVIGVWTMGLVIHGVTWPWRTFHIASGENALGEWLSAMYHSDFSRVIPSWIRPNDAGWAGVLVVIFIITVGLKRRSLDLWIPGAALAMAFGFNTARQPGPVVHFEDAHVAHEGGSLHPHIYTPARFAFIAGWIVEEGDSLTFLAREGTHTLHAVTGLGATIELAGRRYEIAAAPQYQGIRVEVPRAGRVTLRCLRGALNMDRLEHD